MKPIFQMEFDPACASYSPLRCELLHRLISALYAANSRSQAALEPESDDDDPDDVYGRPQPEGPRVSSGSNPRTTRTATPPPKGQSPTAFTRLTSQPCLRSSGTSSITSSRRCVQ